MEDKAGIMLEIAWNYFWKHCPDPKAYFEDWSEELYEQTYKEAVMRM